MTNLFLYHLQRHSDHHANPTRRYQTLRSMAGSPNLPSGYASMISLTYFPPLWRKVMDHRVLDHYDGDISKVNLQPTPGPEAAGPPRGGGMSAAYRCPVCEYIYDEAERRTQGRLSGGHRLGAGSRRLVLSRLRGAREAGFRGVRSMTMRAA